jgi:hypothetical protein
MKINSHLVGFGVVAAFIVGWMWFADKTVETYKGYTIIKSKGQYVAERMPGDRASNPLFSTIEQVRAWVDIQQVQSTVSNLATALPWSQ